MATLILPPNNIPHPLPAATQKVHRIAASGADIMQTNMRVACGREHQFHIYMTYM